MSSSSYSQLHVPTGDPETTTSSSPSPSSTPHHELAVTSRRRRTRRWFDVLTSSVPYSLGGRAGEARHAPLPQHDTDDHHDHCNSSSMHSNNEKDGNSTCSSTCSPAASDRDDEQELHPHIDVESQQQESLLLTGGRRSSFQITDSSLLESDDSVEEQQQQGDENNKSSSQQLRLPFRHSSTSSSSSLLTVVISDADETSDDAPPQRLKHTESAVSSSSSRAGKTNKEKRHPLSKSTTKTTNTSSTSSCSTTERDDDDTTSHSSAAAASSSSSNEQHEHENAASPSSFHVPRAAKLLFGAIGIYSAYLVYGHFQEDLFTYKAAPTTLDGVGETFQSVWLLQTLESFVNVLVGAVGRCVFRRRRRSTHENLHVKSLLMCGVSQLFAKGFTSAALAAGLSFPVAILCKSAKIVPVMLGSLVLGQSRFGFRDYLFAALVVSGTAMLTAGSKKADHSSSSTPAGLICIAISLVADGVTGGLQKRVLRLYQADGNRRPSPFDFMFYTNLAMTVLAALISVSSSDLRTGLDFLQNNPVVVRMIATCCICSAVGQSFVFYVVATFDPVVCATITTTRKILSVLWSVLSKGHVLSPTANVGLSLAFSGLLIEVHNKATASHHHHHHNNTTDGSSDGAAATTNNAAADDDHSHQEDDGGDDNKLQSISKSSTASMSSQEDDDDDDEEAAAAVHGNRTTETMSVPIVTVY